MQKAKPAQRQSIQNLPHWRHERQGTILLNKQASLAAPDSLLAVRSVLLATYRHALFLERSDEVSLDVQLWTCANSLRIYATAWLTSMVRSFPVLWNKKRCRWASTTWTCLLSHSCTWSRFTGPIHTRSFSRLFGVHLPSRISRSLVHVFLWSVPTFSKLDLQSCSSLNALRYVTDPVTFLDRTRDTYG